MRVAQLVGVLLSITPDSTANLQGSGGEETSSGSDAATPAPTTTTANPGYHRGNRPMTADEWVSITIIHQFALHPLLCRGTHTPPPPPPPRIAGHLCNRFDDARFGGYSTVRRLSDGTL
jgi:hypothetical protein